MTTPDDHLLLKFLSGAATEEERLAVLRWAQASPDHQKMLADLQQIYQAGPREALPGDYQTAHEWRKLQSKLDQNEHRATVKRMPWVGAPLFKIAASITIFAVCAFLIYNIGIKDDVITHESGAQRREIALPDGSIVTLNTGSRISYGDDFTGMRSLTLSGEAFFEVKRDPGHPFVIHTGAARVRVLGTSFNVRAYDAEGQNEVYVVTGKVQLAQEAGDNSAIALTPGERGVLQVSNGAIIKSAAPDPNLIAWKSRALVFRKAALHEVIPTLERYFQVSIKLKNPDLRSCRFTSTFEDPGLDEVIEALSVSFRLNVVRQDSQYIFDGDGCGN